MHGILLVHAHPDDETIATGATMAHYAAAGVPVTLVTCTLGEEGEIHLPELSQLAADQADQLGGYRISELAAACAALGVRDFRFLGGAGRYRDSGMMGTPANDHPRCFWRADVDEAAGQLLEVLREVRPRVLITYDPDGMYGHPDHIQAHRVAMRAAELAGSAGCAPDKIYWTAVPRSSIEAGMEQFRQSSDNPFADVQRVEDVPFGVPDEQVTAGIRVAGAASAAKAAAMRAHASQIPPQSWLHTLAGGSGPNGEVLECYQLVAGTRGPGEGQYGWETDLFAGLAPA